MGMEGNTVISSNRNDKKANEKIREMYNFFI